MNNKEKASCERARNRVNSLFANLFKCKHKFKYSYCLESVHFPLVDMVCPNKKCERNNGSYLHGGWAVQDFGFWVDHESIECDLVDGTLIVQSCNGYRTTRSGEDADGDEFQYLHVNDHGNMTLYERNNLDEEFTEVWAIV